MKKDEGVEIQEASGLDEAHEDLMVFDALVGAIAKGDLAKDDVVAK